MSRHGPSQSAWAMSRHRDAGAGAGCSPFTQHGPASLRGRLGSGAGRTGPGRAAVVDRPCALAQAGLSASIAARAAALSLNHCASIAV